MDPETHHPFVDAAIKAAGNQAELARRCGCAQQTISKLLKKEIPVTPQMAVSISRAVDGAVTIGSLYPELVEAVARELGSAVSAEGAVA